MEGNEIPSNREHAVELRKQGLSYREIRELIPVPKSTLSGWLQGVELTELQMDRMALLQHIGRTKAARTIQARRLAREQATRAAARAEVSALADERLFAAGVVAYWAEGEKSKPWQPSAMVTFINSDAGMILLFLRWLELIGIERDRLRFRVSIHESADVAGAIAHWSRIVGVPADQFQKTILKRHRPRTVRHNVGEDYFGCLVVRVTKSVELNRKIAGWWEGLSAQLGSVVGPIRSGVV
jgi:chorismate mutase